MLTRYNTEFKNALFKPPVHKTPQCYGHKIYKACAVYNAIINKPLKDQSHLHVLTTWHPLLRKNLA